MDDVRLESSITWLLGGISQMQPGLAEHLNAPIRLRVNGPGSRDIVLTPGESTPIVTPHSECAVRAIATVASSTEDFLAWSTQGLPWSELARIEGDHDVAAEFLDALNLI